MNALNDMKRTTPEQPELKLSTKPDYRDSYANSVQVRMSVWDFFLVFGTMHQESPGRSADRKLSGRIPKSAAGEGAVERPRPQSGSVRTDVRYALALEPKFTPPTQAGGPVN